jgi:hypothetical protein
MKALKITVAGLLVVIAGLLFAIERLAHRQSSGSNPTVAAQAPAPAAAASTPEPATTPAPATPETTPPPSRKKHATRTGETARRSPEAPPAAAAPVETAAAAPPPAPAPTAELPKEPPAPPAPRRVTIPAGTAIVVRTQNTLSSERNLQGDTFVATLDQPLVVDGYVVAERGAEVEGVVTRVQKAGRVEGVADLEIELVRLHTADGQRIPIATDLHDVQGPRSRGSDAKKIGAAAGIGAVIGAIAGGGKGAAIGAGIGAGAGGGTVLATRGKPSVIPSESRLTFRLRTPVEITERRSG